MAQRYVALLRGDEAAWDAATDEARAAAYANHDAFAAACAEHGHTVVGGEELEPAATALVVRLDGDGSAVTDGPYTETVEQLGGYYVIDTDDVQDLARLMHLMMWPGDVVELRPVHA